MTGNAAVSSKKVPSTSEAFKAKFGYAEQNTTYYNDGRETELLQRIYRLPKPDLEKIRNNPEKVIQAIDVFATEKYLMNIGELKGKIVTDLISKARPSVGIELGGYVGYSTILFGAALRKACPKARYYCIEHNPIFAAVILSLADLAGLSDTIKVCVGESTYWIRKLAIDGIIKKGELDYLFLDHLKPLYTQDLRVIEELGLLKVGRGDEGALIVADNMIKPGNPKYHRYVNLTVEEKRAEYGKPEKLDECEEKGVKGDPGYLYESKFIESWEPQGVKDAIEVTRVVGKMEWEDIEVAC